MLLLLARKIQLLQLVPEDKTRVRDQVYAKARRPKSDQAGTHFQRLSFSHSAASKAGGDERSRAQV